MGDCSKHKTFIEGYDYSTPELIEAIGDLRYDTLSSFLTQLSLKLLKDRNKDAEGGRKKLAATLNDAAYHINVAGLEIDKAWEISKPFMKL